MNQFNESDHFPPVLRTSQKCKIHWLMLEFYLWTLGLSPELTNLSLIEYEKFEYKAHLFSFHCSLITLSRKGVLVISLWYSQTRSNLPNVLYVRTNV